MNRPKVEPEGPIQFLIASPRQVTCTEAARVQPAQPDPPAHDAFARLLTRLEPDPEALWQEARPQIRPGEGAWVLDDSTLDKPYARAIELVHPHWSGKHNAVVDGINLLTLVWTDGERRVPCDGAVYDKPPDGLSKDAHVRALLRRLRDRGRTPRRARSATTSASPSGRSCAWRRGAPATGSLGSTPKQGSSATPSGLTWHNRNTYSARMRNTYTDTSELTKTASLVTRVFGKLCQCTPHSRR